MRYFLPPPEDPIPRAIGRAAPVSGAGRLDAHPEPETADVANGRLVRLSRMDASEARAHLGRWEAEAPAHDLPAPARVVARERSRPDRIHPGTRRRQRIALTTGADPVTLAHWSVPEPPTEDDERAWRRALDRLADAPPGGAGNGPRTGWSA